MSSLHKLLVVCHSENTRESAYEIISHLKEFGYSSDLCHVNNEEEVPSKVSAAQVLDGETSLSGYDGIIFLDDGGDKKAALALAKKALKKDIVIGGHGLGTLILNESGLLKDHEICSGLPDECYEKGTKIEAPSVRSDNIVTSMDSCATGFAILLVDTLGGKVKNVVTSDSPENSDEAKSILSSTDATANVIAAYGGPRTRTSSTVSLLDCMVPQQKVMANNRFMVRRIHEGFLVSDSLSGKHNIMSSKETSDVLGKSVLISSRHHFMKINDKKYLLAWQMNNGPRGWRAINRVAYSDEETVDAVELLMSVLGDEGRGLANHADQISEEIASILQSMMSDANGMGSVIITFTMEDDDLVPLAISESLPQFKKAKCECPCRPRDPGHRMLVERELANEDIWIQPGGSVAMIHEGGIKRLSDIGELIVTLKTEAIRSIQDEIEALNRGDIFDARRAAKLSLRSRHRLRLAHEMASLTDVVHLAGPYPSTISGPYSNLDLSINERVFTWKEGDDFLSDREKSIRVQTRYNPEYDKISPGSQDGLYYVWDEQQRMPTDWLDVISGEDSVYPMRNQLKR